MTTQLYKSDVKDIVIVVGDFRDGTVEAIRGYNKANGTELRLVILADQYAPKRLARIKKRQSKNNFDIVVTSFRTPVRIKKALEPLKERVFSVTTQYENYITEFKKVIPHLPYISLPTISSLEWASDKILMRQMLEVHNSDLVPKFYVAEDATLDTLEKVQKKVGYPVIVKPAGLAGSRLVSICFHEDELQHVLRKTFRKLNKIYREQNGRGEPKVLIEKVIEGIMYSVDGYVDSKGKVYTCPPAHIKTGKEIGFDDFFGYRQMTPTQLTPESISAANEATIESIQALGLRSTTFHAELFKLDSGWKIIEVAPRQGGFRHEIYSKSFGIDHIMNDILIHADKKPVIPKKQLGYAATFKMYAPKEGILQSIDGLPAVKKLASCYRVDVNHSIGDEVGYAKNGMGSVLNVFLFNEDRAGLLADQRRLEQGLKIRTTPSHVLRRQVEETADAILQPIEEVELKGRKVARKVRKKVVEALEELEQ